LYERGTGDPCYPLFIHSRHCISVSTQKDPADLLIKKPSIIIILPAHMLRLSFFRLLQHFHTSLAQLLLHSLRHLCPQVVCEVRETGAPVLLQCRGCSARVGLVHRGRRRGRLARRGWLCSIGRAITSGCRSGESVVVGDDYGQADEVDYE
jgi:hypothetical protein